jgi:subtilisin family serine protease
MIKKGWNYSIVLIFLVSILLISGCQIEYDSNVQVDSVVESHFSTNFLTGNVIGAEDETISVIITLKDNAGTSSENLEERVEAINDMQELVLDNLEVQEKEVKVLEEVVEEIIVETIVEPVNPIDEEIIIEEEPEVIAEEVVEDVSPVEETIEPVVIEEEIVTEESESVPEVEVEFELERKFSTINAISGEVTEEGLEKLKQDSNVERIDYNYPLKLFLDSSVPPINGNDVWDISVNNVSLNGTGETVCVIDTGIDYTNTALGGCTSEEFLAGNCSKVIGGYDLAEDDANPIDVHSHGTHVAGIVASEDATYRGVAPGAKLIAMKVFTDAGAGNTDDALAAIDWCVNNASQFNISVITMSIGVTDQYGVEIPYLDYCDDSDLLAAEATWAANQGIFIDVSAGNNRGALGITSPACAVNATSVGSTTDSDVISGYNTAPILDLLAPGSSITSTNKGSGFTLKSGTSMAAPHVAGAAAIVKQYWKLAYNQNITPQEIENKLKLTGVLVNDTRNGILFPRIDVLAAIQPYINYTSPTPANNTEQAETSVVVNITSDVNLSSALLEWDNGTAVNYTMNQSGNTNFYYTLSGLTAGNYTYLVYGNDSVNTFGISETRLLIIDTTIPNITFYTPLNNSIYNSGFNLNISIANLLLVASTYNLTNSSGDLIQNNSNLTINQANFTWTDLINISNPTFNDDNYTLTAWANDSLGNPATSSMIFTVDKTAPSINSINRTPEIVYNNNTVIFNINVTDLYLNASKVYLESNLSASWVNYSMNTVDNQTFNFSITGTSNLSNQKNIAYRFYAYDTIGNLNTSSTYNFTIQNRNISFVNITSPVDGITVELGASTSFSGSAVDPDGDTITYSWNFGDGNTSSEQNPSNIYAAVGTYVVNLTTTDGYGYNLSDTISITVSDTTIPVITDNSDSESHYSQDSGLFNIAYDFFDYSKIKNATIYFDTTRLSYNSTYCSNMDTTTVTCSWAMSFTDPENDTGAYYVYVNITDNSSSENQRNSTYSVLLSSCQDSSKNGDETGVDCGGSCSACAIVPAESASSGGGSGGGGGGGGATSIAAVEEVVEEIVSSEESIPDEELVSEGLGSDVSANAVEDLTETKGKSNLFGNAIAYFGEGSATTYVVGFLIFFTLAIIVITIIVKVRSNRKTNLGGESNQDEI